MIDAILEGDRTAPVKQRHTARRIFERLRDEHDFAGGYTVVKDYVRICRARGRETFVPLAHPPGHAQVDFGEAVGVIGGMRQKIHFFCMTLPQSDACFVKAYPRETTEAFLDGHVPAFAFIGGVPLSILYDYVPGHIIGLMWPVFRMALISLARHSARRHIATTILRAHPSSSFWRMEVVSLDTTNRYAEINIRMKEEALEACRVPSASLEGLPRRPVWRSDPTLLEWLSSL